MAYRDFEEFLDVLNACGVRYLIVGGLCGPVSLPGAGPGSRAILAAMVAFAGPLARYLRRAD